MAHDLKELTDPGVNWKEEPRSLEREAGELIKLQQTL